MIIAERMPNGTHQSETHVYFWGSYLSNWANVKFTIGDLTFTSSEQALMYYKALLFSDTAIMEKILETDNCRKQKALGREVAGYDDDIWATYRYAIMVDILKHKFAQNPPLLKQLLATESRIIVEASPLDRIWGVGLGVYDLDLYDKNKWRGTNLLGKALMEVRDKLNG